ncbi:MAG: MAE_28990/MAE_18760 family HEPN-like nuclease [Methylovirgula sp.]
MFSQLATEVEARFAAAQSFFGATKEFEGDNAATAKGLAFVQVYAVYEFTVCSVVRAAIESIKAHNHRLRDLNPSLMALALDPELSSLRDGGDKKIWENRINLFNKAFSGDRMEISSSTGPPHDGSHFRYTQLQMIFRVFGISRVPVKRRAHIGRINEVVGHRNLIAHGTEKANDIGRRYTRADISHITAQMRSVCLLLIQVFERYCSDGSQQLRRGA